MHLCGLLFFSHLFKELPKTQKISLSLPLYSPLPNVMNIFFTVIQNNPGYTVFNNLLAKSNAYLAAYFDAV
jgi:hypothetical protein